jgi:hypothetical protein
VKSIETLVQDIRNRISSADPFDPEVVKTFSDSLAAMLASRLAETHGTPSLRLSNLGTPDRKLWYSINRPESAERLPPSARLKFLYGDIIEHTVLFLAAASGHTVEFQQREVDLYGVRGHIDAVIDGELVDVKSASSFSFKKFRDHGLERDDPFGYRTQLNGYLHGLTRDVSTVRPDRAHFLAVDKTLGHICLDTHPRIEVDYEQMVRDKRAMLAWPTPPSRCYSDVPDGKSGNRKLDLPCSYCSFKATCWPGLRVFQYSNRPVFLTAVKKQPQVDEITLEEAQED